MTVWVTLPYDDYEDLRCLQENWPGGTFEPEDHDMLMEHIDAEAGEKISVGVLMRVRYLHEFLCGHKDMYGTT